MGEHCQSLGLMTGGREGGGKTLMHISIPARHDVHTHNGGAGRVGPFDRLVKILIGSRRSDVVKHGVTFFLHDFIGKLRC